jgi:hypothetical protein
MEAIHRGAGRRRASDLEAKRPSGDPERSGPGTKGLGKGPRSLYPRSVAGSRPSSSLMLCLALLAASAGVRLALALGTDVYFDEAYY